MKPPVSKQYFALPHGLWGLVDVAMHCESLIAQHPDAARREVLLAAYKRIEHNVSLQLLDSYHDIECEVDAALQHGATEVGDDGR
jgi:hypothetical protein